MNFQIDKAILEEEIKQNNCTYEKMIKTLEKSSKTKHKRQKVKTTFS